jgi:hypothetical protein
MDVICLSRALFTEIATRDQLSREVGVVAVVIMVGRSRRLKSRRGSKMVVFLASG